MHPDPVDDGRCARRIPEACSGGGNPDGGYFATPS